ncbi:MAG: hypothetical protein WCT14_01565 [Treponemataceae bacterium]
MQSRSAFKVYFLIFLTALFFGCGAMDTMISTSASYKVGAFVNDRDLSELAVIGSTNVIRPLYVPESAKDPDVVALRVILKNEKGEQAAETVEYRERSSSSRATGTAQNGLMLVDSLSSTLPTFSLPTNLTVGRYSLVFQVVGEDSVLYEEKRSFYYIADKAFALTALASFPPGFGPTSDAPLFPTQVPLLLEATIDVGQELDPYLVWSFEGKRISAARSADGGTRIMWTTPRGAGFYRIDVSLYPTTPSASEISSLAGITRSITIAASPTAAYPGLPKADADYDGIFRFLGDLTDRGSAADSGKPLEAQSKLENEWLPFATGYGLAIGPKRAYKAANPAIPVITGAVPAARVILLAAIRKAGLIWETVFEGDAGTDSNLRVRLESTVSGPVLTVSSNKLTKTVQAQTSSPFIDEAQLFEIEFGVSENTIGALNIRFLLDEKLVGEIETAVLTPLSSKGYFRLGGTVESKTSSLVSDTITAIIDELALSTIKPEPVPTTTEIDNVDTEAHP